MSTLAVVGAQWGDEGKGKVVDVLAAEADLVARFAGGNNAGHTLVVGGKKIITHLVPSGCTYPGTRCLLGAGMVIDPEVFAEEIAEIRAHGLLQGDELRVSLDAHVIFPFHRELDGLREDASAAQKIGTTRRGIGPAYEAKVGRRGIRVRDLLNPARLRARLEHNKSALEPEFARLGGARQIDVDALCEVAAGWAQWLRPMVCDASAEVLDYVAAGRPVLFEGAQGALLDVDHGTYPYVTSSSTIAGGVCTGLGVGPTLIDGVWGITKAYTTRVGAGPFPTRLDGEQGERIRAAGGEYGATTGRPRDCGWLDLPALRLAARRNGLTGLVVTKLDVLAELPAIEVCTRYQDDLDPGRDGFDDAVPVFEPVPDWGDPSWGDRVSAARSVEDLPKPVRAYLDLISEHVDVPVTMISVGADREQTIRLGAAF
ncbi:Adenylosuccinate synthetase [Enhygromyxa salina]|uniref:Adenylosuccinate synthetase n=1 Tax=Enhygromyxa salina TaxID=215803 RepID=A0A2S9XDU3_9BACT|nr:adenylosuccinate synthase [Enhygromyxa salina]PRP91027.1 Adenylosuccinate synthetase [Enhygromyxa salina]